MSGMHISFPSSWYMQHTTTISDINLCMLTLIMFMHAEFEQTSKLHHQSDPATFHITFLSSLYRPEYFIAFQNRKTKAEYIYKRQKWKSNLSDSNQRPKDYLLYQLQSSALPTELRSDHVILAPHKIHCNAMFSKASWKLGIGTTSGSTLNVCPHEICSTVAPYTSLVSTSTFITNFHHSPCGFFN